MAQRGDATYSAVHEPVNGWIRVCQAVLYPLAAALGRRHMVGLEHLAVPGPVLLVGNHISHVDPIFDAVLVKKAGRIPHIMAKASLWKIPIVRGALKGTGQIPVERGGGQGQIGLDAAIKRLTDGGVVLIYPEGTVTRDPDMWPMRPRPGVAALALAGDFPVLPLAHWGTHHVYRSYVKGGFRPLPRKDVHLRVGPPIDLSEYRSRPTDARAIRDVSYLIMSTIRDMVAEIRDEPAPTELFNPAKADRAARAGQPGTVPDPTADGENR